MSQTLKEMSLNRHFLQNDKKVKNVKIFDFKNNCKILSLDWKWDCIQNIFNIGATDQEILNFKV